MLAPYLELHKQGRLLEAEAGYREALGLDPDNAEALHVLAIVRGQQGDLVGALDHAHRAVALRPDLPNYLMTLGSLQFQDRQFANAARHFEATLSFDPNRVDAWTALGHASLLSGNLTRAEESFAAALRIADERPDVLSGFGNTLMAKGELDRAIKYLTRAVEMAPKNPGMLAQLGRAYLEKGLFAFARQALSSSLSIDSSQLLVHLMLAETERLAGDRNAAEQALRPLLSGTVPYRVAGHVALGELAQGRGDMAAAESNYQAALALDPASPRAVEAQVLADLAMDRGTAALQVLDSAIAVSSDPVNFLRRKAQVLAMLFRHAEGANALARAVELRDDPAIYSDLATARALVGDWEGAGDAAAHVGDGLGPVSSQARIVAARAALERGDEAAAQAALARIDRSNQGAEQQRATDSLQALVDDRLGRADRALEGWLSAHALQRGEPRPALPPVNAEALEIAIAAARGGPHPIIARRPAALLLGSPGSGVELIAALLSDQPGLDLRNDRFSTDPRRDWLMDSEAVAHMSLSDGDSLERLARRYTRPLERSPSDPARALVDWIPTFDARVLPLLHAVFGESRLVIVGRDPRDALLNWIALGGAHRLRIDDPVLAATWLRQALDHLALAVRVGHFKVLAIDSDRFAVDPTKSLAALASFLDQPPLVPGDNFRRVQRAASGLPSRFPPGRWQAYAGQLDRAFAKL
jgi:tetratricopeptide (TPR) repeat protein